MTTAKPPSARNARFLVLIFSDAAMLILNVRQQWLAELQRRCLERGGVFCSLDELTRALEEQINLWNEDARPFTWTRAPGQIIDRICRSCSRISKPARSAVLTACLPGVSYPNGAVPGSRQ